ncbi:MAG: response regulator [Gemmatimonadetes bacterium]|nr:response regulator [Gemmatimonadota bacterium]
MTIRVLVAEDSPTQREALRAALEEGGYAVSLAASGDEALRRLETEPVDLVVSDIVMPGQVDGYELCRRIKEGERRDTPVILLTSLSDPMDIIRGLEVGADNFLTKPCPADHLLERLRLLLATREARGRARVRAGISVYFMGREFRISAEREQILDLLITTFEDAVRQNRELRQREAELSRSRETLAGLYEIAVGLNACTSEQQVAEVALDRSLRLPGVRAGWVSLKEEGERFRVAAARNLPPALAVPDALEGDCLCRRRLLAGDLERATDVIECERLQRATGDAQGLRHHASVPLICGDRVCGIMNLVGEGPELFTDDDLTVLHGVGSQIAFSIERARLLTRLEYLVEERTAALRAEIDERERAQEALRLSDSILLQMGNLVLVNDGEGRIHWVSPSVRTVLGFEPKDVLGDGWWRLTSPDADERLRLREQAAREARGEAPVTSEPYERVIAGWDGAIHWTLWAHSRGPNGLLIRVGYDITDRKRLEDQFHQAQKLEAVGRLAGGVAHDFNNVLTAIIGTADLLLMDADEGTSLHDDLFEIRKAAERAAQLTRQLLAFARKQVTQPKVLNLNDIVRDLEAMLRRVLREDVALATTLAPDLGNVRVDPGQMEQVIMNLVVNARDAMPAGGTLTIETRNVELDEGYARTHGEVEHGRYVRIEDSDTGIGMNEDIRAHIFEPFFTSKTGEKGTGLGLATVHGIVRQSHGHIWVYTEPGQGTSFKIYLPLVDAPSDAVLGLAVDSSFLGGNETILVAEDSDSVRSVAVTMLRRVGYTVLEAGSGTEALAVAEAHAGMIHLLLADVVMPGLDARTLAQRFLAIRPGAKILFMSGYADEAITQQGLLEPGLNYIEKPFGPDALLRRVRDLLDRPAS